MHQTLTLLDALRTERGYLKEVYDDAVRNNDLAFQAELRAELSSNRETTAELENLLTLVDHRVLSPGDPRPDHIGLAFKLAGVGPEAPGGEYYGTGYDNGPDKFEGETIEIDLSGVVALWNSSALNSWVDEEVGPKGESAD